VHLRDDVRDREVENRLADDVVTEPDGSRSGRQQACVDATRKRPPDHVHVAAGHRGEQFGTLEPAQHRPGDEYVGEHVRQQLKPGLDHAADRPGDQRRPAPPVGLAGRHLHRPGPQVGVDHLLDEQRHTVGAGGYVGGEFGGHGGAEQVGDQLADRPPVQRVEFKDGGGRVAPQ
jgi:hypothetical protein